jgi:hypothetical protein
MTLQSDEEKKAHFSCHYHSSTSLHPAPAHHQRHPPLALVSSSPPHHLAHQGLLQSSSQSFHHHHPSQPPHYLVTAIEIHFAESRLVDSSSYHGFADHHHRRHLYGHDYLDDYGLGHHRGDCCLCHGWSVVDYGGGIVC